MLIRSTKMMKSLIKNVLFTMFCFFVAFIPVVIASLIAEEKMSTSSELMDIMSIISLGLVILASRIYPYKNYDSSGFISGMHKSAIKWSLFLMCGTLFRMGIGNESGYGELEGIRLLILPGSGIACLSLYYITVNFLFKKAVVENVEQHAVGNPFAAE